MDDRPESYIIPANIADNGNVIRGYFKKKNAYEAAAILVLGLIISVLLLGFLPVIPRIIIFVIFALLAFVALAGIKGESFIEYILEFFFFKKKKRIMKYRLPRREIPKESKKRKHGEWEEEFDL